MKPGSSGPRRDGWLTDPHPNRLAENHPQRAEILGAHQRAVAMAMSTYRDPETGASVFTATYLAERGYCCSQGCRHCPWEGAGDAPESD